MRRCRQYADRSAAEGFGYSSCPSAAFVLLYVTSFIAAHAQRPAWTGLQLGNSQAIIIEAASRIASQHSQDTHRHRVVLDHSQATLPLSGPLTQRTPHHPVEPNAQDNVFGASKAADRAADRPLATFVKAELGGSSSLALLKSLNR